MTILENIILIISLMLLGILLRKFAVFPNNTAQVLNLFVIYISLPALVLITIPKLEFTTNIIFTALIPWLALLVSVILLLISAKVFKWSNNTLGALLLIVPLGNTSFLGVPMVNTFFSDSAVAYALIYDQLGSFLALAVYGSLVLAFFSKQKTKSENLPTGKAILLNIITFPPFISLVIALSLHFVVLPELYYEVLSPIAMTLVPVVMIAVGFQLSIKLDPADLSAFIMGLSIKMLIVPLLFLAAFFMLGLNGPLYKVVVFESAMPPMISAGALAIMANLSPKLTAAMLAYGILISFVTLPVLFVILNLFL